MTLSGRIPEDRELNQRQDLPSLGHRARQWPAWRPRMNLRTEMRANRQLSSKRSFARSAHCRSVLCDSRTGSQKAQCRNSTRLGSLRWSVSKMKDSSKGCRKISRNRQFLSVGKLGSLRWSVSRMEDSSKGCRKISRNCQFLGAGESPVNNVHPLRSAW